MTLSAMKIQDTPQVSIEEYIGHLKPPLYKQSSVPDEKAQSFLQNITVAHRIIALVLILPLLVLLGVLAVQFMSGKANPPIAIIGLTVVGLAAIVYVSSKDRSSGERYAKNDQLLRRFMESNALQAFEYSFGDAGKTALFDPQFAAAHNMFTDDGRILYSSGITNANNTWFVGSFLVLFDGLSAKVQTNFLRLELPDSYPHSIIHQHELLRDLSHPLEKRYLRLEGNFSDTFDIYGDKTLPPQTTLEILTPDVMEYIAANLHQYDSELRGNYLWMYWRDNQPLSPERLTTVLETAAHFAQKLHHNV